MTYRVILSFPVEGEIGNCQEALLTIKRTLDVASGIAALPIDYRPMGVLLEGTPDWRSLEEEVDRIYEELKSEEGVSTLYAEEAEDGD